MSSPAPALGPAPASDEHDHSNCGESCSLRAHAWPRQTTAQLRKAIVASAWSTALPYTKPLIAAPAAAPVASLSWTTPISGLAPALGPAPASDEHDHSNCGDSCSLRM